jgi:hypothetical protein
MLDIPVEHWDAILTHLMASKLDCETRKEWELHSVGTDIQVYDNMTKFLDGRRRALESSEAAAKSTSASKTGITTSYKTTPKGPPQLKGPYKSPQSYQLSEDTDQQCPVSECKQTDSHRLNSCDAFKRLNQASRFNIAKSNKLCINCLAKGHTTRDCNSQYSCRECRERHHTLLHRPRSTATTSATSINTSGASVATTAVSTPTATTTSTAVGCSVPECNTPFEVLLATALIDVPNHNLKLRAMLDSGSQTNFIREDAARALNLPFTKTKVNFTGVGQASTSSKYITTIDIGHGIQVNCFILPTITSTLPARQLDISGYSKPSSVKLADPGFNKPGRIDLLLGAEVYDRICLDTKLKEDDITFQETLFGYVVRGPLHFAASSTITSHHTTASQDLSRFWEVEEVPTANRRTSEEQLCEQHFTDTTRANSNGRLVVQLPFNCPRSELGTNRDAALRRFYSLERRLQRTPAVAAQYKAFIHEFIEMGHLELASSVSSDVQYFLPHHHVEKDSTTTKLRVVFDASCKTSSGKSLNDCLLVGPRVQDDLFQIILRFRTHQYVISADIAKMYRQFELDVKDRSLHKLFWRDTPNEPLQVYQMTRVTYGVASSSYHSTKGLQEVAKNHSSSPDIQRVIEDDFYVDDLLTGARTLEEAIQLEDDLISTLAAGQLPLRKFSSNFPELVTRLPTDLQEAGEAFELRDRDHSIKALGIRWKPLDDAFFFSINLDVDPSQKLTKRILLSQVSKLFDPLGWLSCITVSMKILLQETWSLEIDWDQELPSEMGDQFREWAFQLNSIKDLAIPRSIVGQSHTIEIFLFCDASEKAYAACIYAVTTDDQRLAHLLVAKSKVAPMKRLSIPRLELCAMHLGTKLLEAVIQSFSKLKHSIIVSISAWSDSTVALAWVSGESHRWCTFVANRVADIQRRQPELPWKHCPSAENPADIPSRGVLPDELIKNSEVESLWWNGPDWLLSQKWPQQPSILETNEEQKRTLIAAHSIPKQNELIDLNTFSCIDRAIRVIAICRRWLTHKAEPKGGFINFQERREALLAIVASEQFIYLLEEFKQMNRSRDGQVDKNSKIVSLYPFIDEVDNRIIRVGGRLARSALPMWTKYPILIPHSSPLAKLLTRKAHLETLHGTASLTLARLRQQFWITRGTEVVRKCIKDCVTCARFTTDIPARAFTNTGIDFAGPFFIRDGQAESKSYICLLICMASKAIHMELASDLSSCSCLAAIKRFVARRGLPQAIYSDNGSNFIGLRNNLLNQKMGITWKLIPPAAPHFGGLWESGVKSAKHHLRRVLGNHMLTFEELSTMLCQVEQILNSRPLTALPDAPDDQLAITPAHLINGFALNEFYPELKKQTISEDEPMPTSESPKKRYLHIRNLVATFWRRWSKEYVVTLQKRKKWSREEANLKTGDIVLISDENSPPLSWPLARIIHAHAGHENRVRVAKLKTRFGTIRRPITKLRKLPIDVSC